MKIKAVGAICGKVKQIVIHDQGSRQWIGDGMFVVAVIVPTPLKASARLWLGQVHERAAQVRDGE